MKKWNTIIAAIGFSIASFVIADESEISFLTEDINPKALQVEEPEIKKAPELDPNEFGYSFIQLQPFAPNVFWDDYDPGMAVNVGFRRVYHYLMSEVSCGALASGQVLGAHITLGGYLYMPSNGKGGMSPYGGLRVSSNFIRAKDPRDNEVEIGIIPNIALAFGVDMKSKKENKVKSFAEIYLGVLAGGFTVGLAF